MSKLVGPSINLVNISGGIGLLKRICRRVMINPRCIN